MADSASELKDSEFRERLMFSIVIDVDDVPLPPPPKGLRINAFCVRAADCDIVERTAAVVKRADVRRFKPVEKRHQARFSLPKRRAVRCGTKGLPIVTIRSYGTMQIGDPTGGE